MNDPCIKLLMAMLCIAGIILLNCDDNNPLDSNGDVTDNRYTAKGAFSFGILVTEQIQFRLEGINGSVTITGSAEADSVHITGERKVKSDSQVDAEDHLQYLVIIVQDLDGEVYVKTIQPQDTHGRIYEVNYTISLPDDFTILASNINGNVVIDTINNTVDAKTVNGEIDLVDITGSVSALVTNGTIRGAIVLPANGIIQLTVTDGNIDLAIPYNTSAEITANIANGNVSVSNLNILNRVSSFGSLHGTLGEGQGIITLYTVNGNIEVNGL